jgi:hypothetical protein
VEEKKEKLGNRKKRKKKLKMMMTVMMKTMTCDSQVMFYFCANYVYYSSRIKSTIQAEIYLQEK